MAAGDLITTDYQYEYHDILLGADTDYDVEQITGFKGYPSVRTSTEDAFGIHGGIPGRHYLPSRLFTIEFNIKGTTDVNFATMEDDLVRALAPRTIPRILPNTSPADAIVSGEIPFVYQHPGSGDRKKFLTCRPVDLDIAVTRRYALLYPHVVARMEATDPRHYDLVTNIATATLPTPGGGLDFPLVFPLDFGVGSSNVATIENAGNADAHWTAIITGPVTNPRIESVSSLDDSKVHYIRFNGLSLIEGEALELGSRYRTAVLNGQSRRAFIEPGSLWFTIPPAPDELTIRYLSDDPTPTSSSVTFHWNNAYWGN